MDCNPADTWTSDALQRGDVASIRQRVLDHPEYLASRDYVGSTPLLSAIGCGNLELTKFMLEHGADPNVEVDDGYTCLLTAVESDAADSARIVDRLIAAGAGIHRTGTNGWTPLHMAAARGQTEKAALLLSAGARVDQRTAIDGCETPLMEAALCGHPELVRLLLDFGADPSLCDTMQNRTPLEIARHAGAGADPSV